MKKTKLLISASIFTLIITSCGSKQETIECDNCGKEVMKSQALKQEWGNFCSTTCSKLFVLKNSN